MLVYRCSFMRYYELAGKRQSTREALAALNAEPGHMDTFGSFMLYQGAPYKLFTEEKTTKKHKHDYHPQGFTARAHECAARKLSRLEKQATVKSNATFASTEGAFKAACQKAGVKPTARQASKWRNKCGAAWKAWH